MTDHANELKRAASRYREAQARADQIMEEARADLTKTIRAAYADQTRVADILRHTGHVWSRTWVEKAVKPEPSKPTKP